MARQLALKSVELIDVNAVKNNLSVTIRNLFSNCKKVCDEIARAHSGFCPGSLLRGAVSPNEIQFERALNQLKEMVAAFAANDARARVRNQSVSHSFVKDFSFESQKSLGVGTVLDRTIVASLPRPQLPVKSSPSPGFGLPLLGKQTSGATIGSTGQVRLRGSPTGKF